MIHTNDYRDNDFGTWALSTSDFRLYAQSGCFTSYHSPAKTKDNRDQRSNKPIILRTKPILRLILASHIIQWSEVSLISVSSYQETQKWED